MTIPETSAQTSEQVRAGLGPDVQQALDVLTTGEQEVYLHMYSTTEHEVVHPVLYAAAERARNLETHRNEVARLTAMIANSAPPVVLTPSTASVSVGPIPHAPKPTPAALGMSGYDGMDKDVRRTIMNDIRKIENYDGTIQGDAARKWVVDCDRFFQQIMDITGQH
ncbi:hypothetical protein N7445_005219 [Penicillium cf. griseofulvum]|nr:hypothetical protein N7445_005219 [Penicillium cf. griseofulvum]